MRRPARSAAVGEMISNMNILVRYFSSVLDNIFEEMVSNELADIVNRHASALSHAKISRQCSPSSKTLVLQAIKNRIRIGAE
jgi:hypothetical protein